MQTRKVRIWPLRLIAFLCALIFLFSAFMTGTYAWQSEQKVLNNMYGAKDVMVPVELVKLEKTADGTETEKPIANTVFYLYRESGTQIGGRYVTDDNGKISILLPAGDYYFEEVSPSIGYTYDTDTNGNSVTRYYFAVVEQEETITVKAYNKCLNGNLQIRKTVENTDGAPLSETQQKTAFEFTVTFSDGGTYSYKIDNGEEQTITSGGTLKLCSGQTAVFETMPVGVLYNVVETPVEGYMISGTGHRGNITEDTQAVADFINRSEQSKLGSLTVSKEVQGENVDPNKEFAFIVTLGDVAEEIKLKHGESKTFVGIPVGTEYIVTEQQTEKYAATVDAYKGRIVAAETVTLPFVNIYNDTPPTDKNGSLTISKTVIGDNADPNKEFTFEVVFTGAGAPESSTFTLKAGEAHTIENIPHGVSYTVFETDANGYWSVLEQASGKIIGDTAASVVFTNRVPTKDTGSITVTKEVKGEGADPNRTFAFTLDIDGDKKTFVLHNGESKTFAGLPIGTKYTVTETDASANGYISTVKEYSGQIVDTADVTLPFVNIYDPTPDGKSGSLTVNKIVTGENADPNKEFAFHVVFEGENAPQAETFTLKSGGSKIFENIPYGVTYTVTETDAAGYDPVVNTASGAIVGDQNAVVTFTNKAPDTPESTVKLTVQKLLAGELLESDKERLFNMMLTVNGKATSFSLKANEIKEFDIPAGAVYEVSEENYIKDGFSQSIVNGSGTATEALTEVIVTNTYVGEQRVEIVGQKTWDMNGYDGVALPESITIQLKNGDLLVEEQIVKPDANNEWHYSFIAPKYNADGTLAEYTLQESTVTGFRASYEGYNIKNTYVKPIEVDPPIITKVVQGDNAPSTAFEFVFAGQHGTPMPEGSVSYRKNLTLTGAGELEIGTITYDKAGTYVYTVHEKNGGAKGWTYDTALYTIQITVTEENHVLTAERTIVKNNSVTDKLEFTNTFEAKNDETSIVSGIKTWDHGNNPEKERPTSIIVEVYGDGKLAAQRQVTAEDNWQYFFELPRFAEDGHEIVYTVDEAPVKDYSKQIDGYDLINTYTGMPDTPDTPDKPGTPSGPVDTGDNSSLVFWIALMVLSLIGFIVTILFTRKRCSREDRRRARAAKRRERTCKRRARACRRSRK